MRSSRVLERLTVNAKVATVLGSNTASSDTMESEGRQMKQSLITYCRGANRRTDIRKIPQIVWAESGSLTVPV
jgi:hypothetical protein